MAESEKKGLTVKIDAALHAEVRKYLDEHEMTMAEFVAMAFEDELHPKNIMKEGTTIFERKNCFKSQNANRNRAMRPDMTRYCS